MMRRAMIMFALTLGLLTLGGNARAGDPAQTTISIPELDCPSCAKKVTNKLAALAGVAKTEVDMKTKTVTVTPKSGVVLSPKAVWETVEQAGQEPSKLIGPAGTFTAKPQS